MKQYDPETGEYYQGEVTAGRKIRSLVMAFGALFLILWLVSMIIF